MQDRYVGDVGDFAKYSLLRRLVTDVGAEPSLRLGIVWCLFPDESHNADGKHISYLKNGNLRHLDPDLHDSLEALVIDGQRSVARVAGGGLFPGDTDFFGVPIARFHRKGRRLTPRERADYRQEWLNRALERTRDCDLVFFDPDNGLQTRTIGKRDLKAGKYVFWDEISAFVERGQALVVYHHTNRTEPVPAQVARLKQEFASKLPGREVIPLVFRRGSCRIFWIVLEGAATPLLNERVHGMMQTDWKLHFEMM